MSKSIHKCTCGLILLTLVFFLVSSFNVLAATYYVDPATGSNANSGTSSASTWKNPPGTRNTADSGFISAAWGSITTSNKIKCGDTILLKGGSTQTSAQGGAWRIDDNYYTNNCPEGNPMTITVATATEWSSSSGPFTIDASGTSLTEKVSAHSGGGFVGVIAIQDVNSVTLGGRDNNQKMIIQNVNTASLDHLSGVLVWARGQTQSNLEVRWFLIKNKNLAPDQGGGLSIGGLQNSWFHDIQIEDWRATGVNVGLTVGWDANNVAFERVSVLRSGATDPNTPNQPMDAFNIGGAVWNNNLPGGGGFWCLSCWTLDHYWNGANSGGSNSNNLDMLVRFRDYRAFGNGRTPAQSSIRSGFESAGDNNANPPEQSVIVTNSIFYKNYNLGMDTPHGAGTAMYLNNIYYRAGEFEASATYNSCPDWVMFRNNIVAGSMPWGSKNCGGPTSNNYPNPDVARSGKFSDFNLYDYVNNDAEQFSTWRFTGNSWSYNGVTFGEAKSSWGANGPNDKISTNALRYNPQFVSTGGNCNTGWSSGNAAAHFQDCNLKLQSTSPAIDAGAFWMVANGAGSGTTINVRAPAGYFNAVIAHANDPRAYFRQPGSYLRSPGDTIMIQKAGGGTCTGIITSMTATSITINTPCSGWIDGAGVSLPWNGNAPDIGAFEFGGPITDTTPPALSNGQPTGTLPAGTTSTTMSVTTNEAATCRYSSTANTAYSSMTNTFTTTGGTSHSTSLTGLSNGNSYTRYVKCQDTAGNANTNDFVISFSVAQSAGNIYYIGQFTGSSPSDNANCGTKANPCATLAYWNQNRRSLLATGYTVRIASGTYGPSGNGNHCILTTPGVLYEGRNADDTEASSSSAATIDVSQTPNSQPCNAQGVQNDGASVAGFKLRYMTIKGATNSGSCMWINPSAASNGLEFRHVRFTGCRNAGFGWVIGDTYCPSPGASCTRRLQNVVINNSEFDNNIGDGLFLGAVDGIKITNSKFHNNGAHFCGSPNSNPQCDLSYACNSDNDDCTDNDGLNWVAGANAVIEDSHAYRNSQVGFDFSRTGQNDECDGSSHSIVVDRSYSYDNGYASYSFSGCANNIVLRNSFAFGDGTGLNMYYGACNLKFYDNTIFMDSGRALFSFSLHTDMDFRNNILSANSQSSAVGLATSMVQANNGGIWDNNVIVNRGSGPAISIFDPTPNTYNEMNNDPDYRCAKLGSPRGNGQSYSDDPSGLTSWRNADYFGTSTANNDKWGISPSFVNSASPNVANLHLSPTDSVAKDSGQTISSFGSDYDNDARPQGTAWDIGADEVKGGIPPVFDFSLSNGGSKTVAQGSSTTNTITSTLSSGTTQSVSFSASGLPSGATSSFSPTQCNPTCTTTMTINTLLTTPAGIYAINVNGNGAGITKTTGFNLNISAINPTSCSWDFYPKDVPDGKVTLGDVLTVVADFGKTSASPGYNTKMDFNNNNQIDLFDVLTVLARIGGC